MDKIEKQLTWKGETTTIYFRELTAGEQLDLARGQRLKGGKDGQFDFDLGENVDKGQRLVQLTLVDVDGKKVYRNIDELRKESAKKVQKLIKLANEAANEDSLEDEEAAGNA